MRAFQKAQRRLLLVGLAVVWLGTQLSLAAETNKLSSVRVAGIVLKWIRTDKEANYRRVEPMIREAATNGAMIVCTTECFLDGYAIADKSIPLEEYRALGEPIPDGKYKGFTIAKWLPDMIWDYYRLSGRHERTGRPFKDTLEKLGLEEFSQWSQLD